MFLLRFVVMVEVFEGLLIGLVLPPMVLVAVVERCIGFASGFETLARAVYRVNEPDVCVEKRGYLVHRFNSFSCPSET